MRNDDDESARGGLAFSAVVGHFAAHAECDGGHKGVLILDAATVDTGEGAHEMGR